VIFFNVSWQSVELVSEQSLITTIMRNFNIMIVLQIPHDNAAIAAGKKLTMMKYD